jgi:succinoglycan biosynthesis protein ExoA
VTSSGIPRDRAAAQPELAGLVTVVVPARNEERAIGRCLDSILTQDYPHLQVIVVDGASDDGTVEVVNHYAKRDPRVELLHNPGGIIPRSLNMAVEHARGQWFVRVDAHAFVPINYVQSAVEHLRTGRWGGVGGRKDGIGGGPTGHAIAAAMGSRFGVGGSTYHYGTTACTVDHIPFGAYPLALIRELGGWDETLRVNQDYEFDYRVRLSGRALLFDPTMVIHWENRTSIGALFYQYRRYGKGKVKVARKHPASLQPRHLAAPALIVLLGTAVIASTRNPRLAAVMVSPYAGGLAIASALSARKLPRPARPWLAPAFVAMHLGWGLGFAEGCAEWAREERVRRPRAGETHE